MASFFGFELKRVEPSYLKKDEVSKDSISFIDRDTESSAAVVAASASMGTFVDLNGNLKSEAELITKYRDMCTQPEVDNAVDEIVNEAICTDEDFVIKIDLKDVMIDPKAKEILQEKFQEILKLLDFNSMAYHIFRRWYVDGRLYYHAVIDPQHPEEGIKEFRYVDPRKLREIKEVKEKRLAGGALDTSSPNVQITKNNYYLYNERGFTPIQKAMTGIQGLTSTGIRISTDSVIHVPSGVTDTNGMLGLSYMHKSIKILNMLRTIEDSLIIYRLARAPERRVWYVNVGNMPKLKAEQYMRDTITNQKNRLIYDADSGTIRDDRKFLNMLEDYYIPVKGDGTSTRVENLAAGKTLGEIEDIVYFQKQLYGSLNVPVDRLQSDAPFQFGNVDQVTRAEIKFDKFITRLRQQFSLLFTKSMERHVVLQQLMSIEEWKSIEKDIKYEFARDNHISELKDAQVLTGRINTFMTMAQAGVVGVYFSHEWIRRNIFKMTEEDIEKMMAEIQEEIADPLLITITPAWQMIQQQQQAEQEQAQAEQPGTPSPDSQRSKPTQKDEASNKQKEKYSKEKKVDHAKHIIAGLKDIPNKTPTELHNLRSATAIVAKN